MKKSLFTILLASLFFITACNKPQQAGETDLNTLKPNTVIMKIDGKKITKKDFDQAFDKLYITSPFGLANVDLSKDRNYDIKLLFTSKAVNDIIIRYYINQEAEKNSVTVTDQDIKEVYDEVLKRIGGKERLLDQIAVANMDEEAFKNSIREDIKAKKVIDLLSKDLKVTDQDIKDYYEKYKNEKFHVPETARASHLFIRADERIIENQYKKANKEATPEQVNQHVKKVIDEKRALATGLFNKLKANPAKWDDIVKESSEDRISALHSGDLGYFPRGKLTEAFDKAVFDPNKAQVSKIYPEVVKSTIGFHIIKVTDHKRGGIMTFDSVKDDIKRILVDAKKVDLLTDFVNKKKANSKIDFVYKEFDQLYINELLSNKSKKPSNQATKDIKLKDNTDKNNTAEKKEPEKKASN